ncbi:MAG: SDR family oxidoreductase [Anaerolineales bacterium]|jgi:uncharacterized protein YbjT (DUF2867 family)|nr:SDR family oxidoreductase [Anaerolineales bacterium]
MIEDKDLILVTGVTGYIGGRLVPRLLEAGYRVRVLARDAGRLQDRPWVGQVEVSEGDVLKPETLDNVMHGVSAAYYLIHSMMDTADFHRRDMTAAQNFGQTARVAGVKRILYLGGLGDPESGLSQHLSSRQQTGDILRQSGVPITEFRAAVIVGSGSVSFEMIRYLTERLPVMICPQWVYTRVQPIGIRNVMEYLVAALNTPESAGKIIEVGGSDVLTYGDMMLDYARVRGLRRYLIPVPVLTPRLSSHWVHWMTPIPAQIARPLIDGLQNEVVVRDRLAKKIFPQIQPLDYKTSVQLALDRLEASQIESSWSDALVSSQGDQPTVELKNSEGMIIERRIQITDAPPDAIFPVFTSLGGERGWPYMNWIWRMRGILDRLVGGVGLRRGRRHSTNVRVGDALDFWRVEAVEAPRLLRLRAEMKLPGRAWLQFDVEPVKKYGTLFVQTAYFAPKGLGGFLYWYVLYPVHSLVFSGMITAIARQAEDSQMDTPEKG